MADLSIDSNLSGSVNTNLGGSVGAIGPVTLAGIPNTYDYHVKELPKINIGVDPIRLSLDPIDASIAIREIPSVRVHLPANYTLAISILGFELAAFQLCGEGQVITEPYQSNPCEACGQKPGVASKWAQS